MGALTRTWGEIHEWVKRVINSCETEWQADKAANLILLFERRFKGIVSEIKLKKLITEQKEVLNEKRSQIYRRDFIR